jgi:hypothetical protein
MGGLMFKLNLKVKTGNRDAEYYLTCLGLKSGYVTAEWRFMLGFYWGKKFNEFISC